MNKDGKKKGHAMRRNAALSSCLMTKLKWTNISVRSQGRAEL